MRCTPFRRRLLVLMLLLPLTAVPLWSSEGYQLPPQEIVDLIDAPLSPQVQFGPSEERAVLMQRNFLTSLEELSETELRLAGLRIKPDLDGPSRQSPINKLRVMEVETGQVREVAGLPEKLRMIYWQWSPSGNHGSFAQITADGIELWVVDLEKAQARRMAEPFLSLTARIEPVWVDDQSLVATFVPKDRGPAPKQARVPKGPVIQENLGEKAAAVTFQDLLANAHDERLFEFYLTSQPAIVGLDGSVKTLGKPAIYWNIEPSPNGKVLLVQSLHRPYSYLVPAFRFPKVTEIWNLQGQSVHTAYERPLQESVPTAYGSVPTGPRQFDWRADAPATLVWAEARDDGDAAKDAEIRDEVYQQALPFEGKPQSLIRLGYRYNDVQWHDGELAIASSWWWKTRQMRAWRIQPDHPEVEPVLVKERSWEDRYNDPGTPMMETNAFGRRVLKTTPDGSSLFLAGPGASPEGDRPFLDRWNLETGESTRLFRSEAPYYESPVRLLDEAGHRLLTRRESVEEVPNYFIRRLDSTADGDALERLTDFPHPTPQLKGIEKKLLKYERDDGVQLTATLYTPNGYDAQRDGPLPMLMWAYPREFKSADAAGQVDDSPYRFDRVGWWSQIMWLTQGYAVLDDPKMPIVGEGEAEPNDTFRSQLVANAKAAVDEVVRLGVAKPGHIAIGGHSYGAFMTANLLAHSDLFAAGIARSGAYNRTLTPFGFQSEERTLWEAPEVYATMSPFMHADKVNEPILLIHGEADNNPGTYPMQSDRYYNALKGHGAVARLVKLPLESHGYRARESILHMLWETHRWLEQYVAFTEIRSEVPEAAGGL